MTQDTVYSQMTYVVLQINLNTQKNETEEMHCGKTWISSLVHSCLQERNIAIHPNQHVAFEKQPTWKSIITKLYSYTAFPTFTMLV